MDNPYIVPGSDTDQPIEDGDLTYYARPGSAVPRVVSLARQKELLAPSGVYFEGIVSSERYSAVFLTEPDQAALQAANWGTPAESWDDLTWPTYEAVAVYGAVAVMHDDLAGIAPTPNSSSSLAAWEKQGDTITIGGTEFYVYLSRRLLRLTVGDRILCTRIYNTAGTE